MNAQALSQLLERRAERIRQGVEEIEEGGAWAAEFSLGGQHYALPLERLLACLPLKGVCPVPLSRPGLLGVLRWQAKVIPAYSLATLLGARGWRRDPATLLVMASPAGEAGFDCEEVPRSLQLEAGVRFEAGRGLATVSGPGGGLLQLLDPFALLEPK